MGANFQILGVVTQPHSCLVVMLVIKHRLTLASAQIAIPASPVLSCSYELGVHTALSPAHQYPTSKLFLLPQEESLGNNICLVGTRAHV